MNDDDRVTYHSNLDGIKNVKFDVEMFNEGLIRIRNEMRSIVEITESSEMIGCLNFFG